MKAKISHFFNFKGWKGSKWKRKATFVGWSSKGWHSFKVALLFWFVHFQPLKSKKSCNLAFNGLCFIKNVRYTNHDQIWSLICKVCPICNVKLQCKGQKTCKNCTEGHSLLRNWVSSDKCSKWNLNTFISRYLRM